MMNNIVPDLLMRSLVIIMMMFMMMNFYDDGDEYYDDDEDNEEEANDENTAFCKHDENHRRCNPNTYRHHLVQELLDDDLLDVKLSEDGDEEKSPNSSPLLLVG